MFNTIIFFFFACTATIQVHSVPSGADLYITKHFATPAQEPISYVAAGTTPFVTKLNYFAWDEFYVWANKEGHEVYASSIPNEIKVGPAIGGLFFWPAWMWAWGPDDSPMYIKFRKKEKALPPRKEAVPEE